MRRKVPNNHWMRQIFATFGNLKKRKRKRMAQNNNPHTLGTESIGKLLLQYSIPAIIGMPAQIEQAIRHQVNPMGAGDFILHASIVHLAGAVVDYEECEPNRRPDVVPFDTTALESTRFPSDHLPALLKEAYEQLQETLAVINPHAMAA